MALMPASLPGMALSPSDDCDRDRRSFRVGSLGTERTEGKAQLATSFLVAGSEDNGEGCLATCSSGLSIQKTRPAKASALMKNTDQNMRNTLWSERERRDKGLWKAAS